MFEHGAHGLSAALQIARGQGQLRLPVQLFELGGAVVARGAAFGRCIAWI